MALPGLRRGLPAAASALLLLFSCLPGLLAKTAAIRGVVLAADGKPAAHAEIVVIGRKLDRTGQTRTLATTSSDENGHFELPPVDLPALPHTPTLVARLSGQAIQWLPIPAGDIDNLVVRLASLDPLSGQAWVPSSA
jgi:hypothetical protein